MRRIKARIASNSMHPVLKRNEEVLMEYYPLWQNLKRFDIIVFRKNDQLWAHFFWRRQEINGKVSFLTRSLANPTENDFPLENEDIVGVIVDKKINYYYKSYVYIRNIISGKF
jgi:signal peptidase I